MKNLILVLVVFVLGLASCKKESQENLLGDNKVKMYIKSYEKMYYSGPQLLTFHYIESDEDDWLLSYVYNETENYIDASFTYTDYGQLETMKRYDEAPFYFYEDSVKYGSPTSVDTYFLENGKAISYYSRANGWTYYDWNNGDISKISSGITNIREHSDSIFNPFLNTPYRFPYTETHQITKAGVGLKSNLEFKIKRTLNNYPIHTSRIWRNGEYISTTEYYYTYYVRD